ncbi:hypothetical protein FRACYDRAFT_233578 [Fragilariopsis cylindrus CCMP1102]|uniref:TLC domain-containing protein n=1 Tax=Fragilariopsis cylindrus CCMP1102 TaxID=635003 RepID=A0A1E7FZ39_9STRA|nr:hypothetical protein FRACYDRAFT_233578 [Fragilariopsis cylindrus CCMP1102]|eukprot:OEU23405.1 hypothetical protein FRACYDRAFT_233578 [Fragilariopsis cylindrus CCMP1102]
MNSNIWLRSARVLVGALFIPFSWQLIGIPAAWLLFGYPIGRLLIVSVEDRFLSPSPHPVVVHFIHLTSGVYFVTRFICFMLVYYAVFYYYHGENDTAYMLILGVHFIIIGCMYIFLLCYGLYFNLNIEEIVAKYDKEFNKERMDNNKEYDHNHEMEKLELL